MAFQGDLIHGQFVQASDPAGEWIAKSPADQADKIGTLHYSYVSIDRAVDAARTAFKKWRLTSPSERAAILKTYQERLRATESELVLAISRETGKPKWEAKTEVGSMLNKIDITLNESTKLVEDLKIDAIMEGTVGSCRYRPHGVAVVVGPFNFPGHLPNGHIVPALASGNTVIFKPSEKTPLTGQIMAQCLHEAGVPPGVFNLVQGEREVGRRLVVHEGIDLILFTGSYEVGLRIKQDTLLQHWKLLALEMGGKNPSIVFEDANLDAAVYECLVSAYVTAGQRCSATSRILVHKSLVDTFAQKFHERAKSFKIGHYDDDPFMGPLIDSASVDRYMKFVGVAAREGAEVVMRGKALDVGKQGFYVAPSICRFPASTPEQVKKSVFLQSEIFAPCVSIETFEDLNEAVELANCSQFGLVASVFTPDAKKYEHARDLLRYGLINWNRPTVGASSKLPFGGLKKSGNHHPTALSASQYCTYPLASLESADLKLPAKMMTGVNWSE